MSAFARAVLGSYNATPYHNMHHGFITFQSCYWAIKRSEMVGRCTTPLERLALLVAAIGHDAGHDGVNNGFHVQKVTDLTMVYNDESPLENLHACVSLHPSPHDQSHRSQDHVQCHLSPDGHLSP